MRGRNSIEQCDFSLWESIIRKVSFERLPVITSFKGTKNPTRAALQEETQLKWSMSGFLFFQGAFEHKIINLMHINVKKELIFIVC